MARVYIGTSGWMYAHWKGNFYPQNLSTKNWLKYYSQYFKTVEVNSSFYRQVKASTFKKWKKDVSTDFVFSIKGNRYITHIKRLKDCSESTEKFFEATAGLRLKTKGKKDVVFWQLPPSFKANVQRVKEFIRLLPPYFRYAFEFRSQSWTWDLVQEALAERVVEISLVLQDWSDWPIYENPMGDFVYIRLHGKDKLYTSNYSIEALANWAKKMQKWISKSLDVYVYFNNDALGYAAENAKSLKKLLEK